jgi:acetylornithine/succinyldiaminopimelate/putrescine aminotransferase
MYHNPVLLDESVKGLQIKPNGVYVDVTFGGGGHSQKILEQLDERGKLFAFEHYPDAIPDILTLGKALGGGMPIGALVANQTLLKTFTEKPMLGHITTFGGHPVICAAAHACLEVLSEEIDWLAVQKKGDFIAKSLQSHPLVRAIRYKGLMFAIDLASSDQVNFIVNECLRDGLIAFWFLSHPYSFRLSPPLNISTEECETAVKIILKAFDKMYQKTIA